MKSLCIRNDPEKLWDVDNSTPRGYWTNSDGCRRRWGDMNSDDRLTSTDALMLLQAAAGTITDPLITVEICLYEVGFVNIYKFVRTHIGPKEL
jgi:hypothetical protein